VTYVTGQNFCHLIVHIVYTYNCHINGFVQGIQGIGPKNRFNVLQVQINVFISQKIK
jgi:hypothetical protein